MHYWGESQGMGGISWAPYAAYSHTHSTVLHGGWGLGRLHWGWDLGRVRWGWGLGRQLHWGWGWGLGRQLHWGWGLGHRHWGSG